MWALQNALRPAKRRRVNPVLPTSLPSPSATVRPYSLSSSRTAVGLRPGELEQRSAQRDGREAELQLAWGSTERMAMRRLAGRTAPLNEAQVPLISPHLRAQLFPSLSSPFAPSPPSPDAVKISVEHLRHHQLLPDPSSSSAKKPPAAIEFDLPRLQGPTITHHFHALGRDVAEPYLSMARSFARAEVPRIPSKQRWVLSPGWTFYSPDGSSEPIAYPPEEEDALVFDVETMPFQGGAWAVMAVAAGKHGWYGWCSPWLTGDDPSPNHLIPLGPSSPSSSSSSPTSSADFRSRSHLFERADEPPRLIIGHNVLYDRARVAQENTLRRPSTRYLDTLSMHVAVSGLTNPQRPTWIKYRKDRDAEEEVEEEAEPDAAEESAETPAILAKAKERQKGKKVVKAKDWKEVASVNSLAEVARLHCGIKVDKALRDVFIDPNITIEDVREHFVDLIDYCARDVDTTLAVYRAVFPKFLDSCPHPATFAGIALMSQPVLPVDRKWPEYLERAEKVYQDRLTGVTDALNALAEEARAKFDQRGEDGRFVWENDLWLRQLDWSPKRARRLPGDLPAKQRTKKQMEQAAKEIAAREAGGSNPKDQATTETASEDGETVPAWTRALTRLSLTSPLVPLLFEVTWRGFPVVFTHSHGWLFAVPTSVVNQPQEKLTKKEKARLFAPEEGENLVPPDKLHFKDSVVAAIPDVVLYTIGMRRGYRCLNLVGLSSAKRVRYRILSSPFPEFEDAVQHAKDDEESAVLKRVAKRLGELAEQAAEASSEERETNIYLRQLDWTPVPKLAPPPLVADPSSSSAGGGRGLSAADLVWPKWYWDLDVPGQGLDVSIGKRASPLLLKLKWRGHPVAYSKQHGWLYRMPLADFEVAARTDSSLQALDFNDVADASLDEDEGGAYVKLPHPDGEGKNVGSPLSKPFVASFEEGILTSEYPTAEAALSLNASCSYWTSARERITNQMVVWEGDAKTPVPTPAAIASGEAKEDTRGLILPQVLPMGTITRRSVERTWLTASNAKKNRVGSELKSMIRAPPGYAIVGADVDSEELWICSVMGDAQFGIHGATAIGWMTLEGTKSAGTDMHSKTASILGISRDDAKVFNYSRIYGAGVKHAVTLLLKANPRLSTDEATGMAQKLYASTKGLVDRSAAFKRNFWHGGTESFVFNKLEGIAKSDRPRTPALGCGLTSALTKAYLPADGKSKAGEGYLPSRINWVVQSSGVDYLHLLIVSMEYLTRRYEIDARYLISVHDEVRYLVKEEDKYRASLALQIANLWTRSLFAYRLQMPDLPQGCAFFSAVDVDSCFRKEVNMTCVTPSNPDAIPFGESLDIVDTLSRTSGGSLFTDGRPMVEGEPALPLLPLPVTELSDEEIRGEQHRVDDTAFLVAQTSSSVGDIQRLWRESQDRTRRAKLGLDPYKSSAARSMSRKSKAAASTAASGTTAEAGAPKKRKSLRFEDDAELMPRPPAATRTAAQAVRRKEQDDDDDDEADWDLPDADDFYESLLPDEVKQRFSIHTPSTRAKV
ncbi:hypothetical protein JCM6882_003516 [Rhodosporidiobolus microsporus]